MSDAELTAALACGCKAGFRTGVEGSPITVVILTKSDRCLMALHVAGMPVFDHREALRPPTRVPPAAQSDFEEN